MTNDDFDKLQQQYFDATIEERNRLWPNFIRAIRETYPGLLEEFEHKFDNGDYLVAMFGQCMKRVLARPDLNAGRKTNALEDAAAFGAALDELKPADPRVQGLAFELATRALFTGLRVGLKQDEEMKLREGVLAELGRSGGKASGEARRENRSWTEHATELGQSIKNPARPNEIPLAETFREAAIQAIKELHSFDGPTKTAQRLAALAFARPLAVDGLWPKDLRKARQRWL